MELLRLFKMLKNRSQPCVDITSRPTRCGRMPMMLSSHTCCFSSPLQKALSRTNVRRSNISPQTSLVLALQTLDWLPTIPWDLSYCVGIPMMFAYGPELYEFQSWSTAGDVNYLLDSHAQAANLLSCKLVCMYSGAGPDDPSPSRAASLALNSLAHSATRSCSHSRTPSHETKMERSCSSSASSTHSQDIKPTSSAGAGGEDSHSSDSTSQEGSETAEEDEASSDGEASGDGEGSDSRSSDSEGSSGGSEIAEGSSSEAEGSDIKSSSSFLETDGEILTRVATPVKETKGGTLTKETKGGNPNSSQMLSLPDLDSKDTVEEWKVQQQHKDAWLLDKNFGEWCDCMISKGHTKWNKCDTMICDHVDPCKEAKFPNPASPPLDYMKHHGVFKSRKTNKYDLCCFYQVGLSKNLPNFPSPCEPPTHELLSKFLLKAKVLGHPNLVVAFTKDSAMAICLLQ